MMLFFLSYFIIFLHMYMYIHNYSSQFIVEKIETGIMRVIDSCITAR